MKISSVYGEMVAIGEVSDNVPKGSISQYQLCFRRQGKPKEIFAPRRWRIIWEISTPWSPYKCPNRSNWFKVLLKRAEKKTFFDFGYC